METEKWRWSAREWRACTAAYVLATSFPSTRSRRVAPRRRCDREGGSFAELHGECAIFCQQVNSRAHRETGKAPSSMLDMDAPARPPHTLALGESRQVLRDKRVCFGSVH